MYNINQFASKNEFRLFVDADMVYLLSIYEACEVVVCCLRSAKGVQQINVASRALTHPTQSELSNNEIESFGQIYEKHCDRQMHQLCGVQG